jgi:hypothetical protein
MVQDKELVYEKPDKTTIDTNVAEARENSLGFKK